MLKAGSLAFQEFATNESLPLAVIQEAVLEFLRDRETADGRRYRLYQTRKSGNRRLADIRAVENLPPARRIAQVRVASPEEPIALKVISCRQRRK